MLDQLSLQRKLMLAFWSTTGGLVVVGGIGYGTLRAVSDDYERVVNDTYANTVLLGEMSTAFKDAHRTIVAMGIPKEHAVDLNALKTAFEDAIVKRDAADQKYRVLPFVGNERALYDAQTEKWKKFLEAARSLAKLAAAGDPKSTETYYRALQTEFRSSAQDYQSSLLALIGFQSVESAKGVENANATKRYGTILSIIAMIGGCLVSIVLGIVLSGRLTSRLDHLLKRLQEGSVSVANTSTQMATGASQLSGSSVQQAAGVQETSASLQQMSAMVDNNYENCKRSLEHASSSDMKAREAHTAIGQMNGAIEEINRSNDRIAEQVEASNRQIGEIVKVIQEIGEKTKVINDIVFQTKLLSFNASVEAARAGEHGRGFAVVAEEVGNLAKMSGDAAKEISSMLDGSMAKVTSIVDETQAKLGELTHFGRSKVETGLLASKHCAEVIDTLLVSVGAITQMVKEISTASSEQSSGIREITRAMGQLDQATQQNSETADESARSSAALRQEAAELEKAVSLLARIVNGGASRNAIDERAA